MTKPRYVYSGKQVREMDREAVAGPEVSGWELMERAGRSAFALLIEIWQEAEKLQVICGTGNNGGDGWVVARLAREAGWQVAVELIGDKNRIEGDAQRALQAYEASGGAFNVRAADQPVPELDADILVDALCGTGATGPLRAGHIAWVEAMNSSGIPIVAMDVPTGLNADTGQPEPVATRAAVTVTFIAEKKGLVTGSAGDFVAGCDWKPWIFRSRYPTQKPLRHKSAIGPSSSVTCPPGVLPTTRAYPDMCLSSEEIPASPVPGFWLRKRHFARVRVWFPWPPDPSRLRPQ